jgi:predicted RNase H-like nuclease (RuvC/YqgF family)
MGLFGCDDKCKETVRELKDKVMYLRSSCEYLQGKMDDMQKKFNDAEEREFEARRKLQFSQNLARMLEEELKQKDKFCPQCKQPIKENK